MKDRSNAKTGRWLGLYTGLYACVVIALGLIMLRYRRTLICSADSIKQHYTVLGYLSQALRELFAGRGWRMMDFSLGQGMDLLTTWSYCGYTDPLNLLGALVQGGGIEWMYMGLDVLRAYLAGITFAVYARRIGAKDGWSLACASAIYVSSGYILWMMGRHIYFLNGALYLPLMLLAVERVLDDRGWLMLTLIAALTLIANFYLAYMNTLVTIVYIIVRLIARIGRRGVAGSAKDGLVLLGAYLLGAAISAVVFVPVVRLFLSNSRLGIRAGYGGSMLHYAVSFYKALAISVFSPWEGPGNFLRLNLAPMAAFGLMGLFCVRGGRGHQARIGLALCVAAACVPMAGYVLNGGAYVSNRWSYALNMFAGLGCALGLPKVFGERRPRQTVFAVLGLFLSGALAAGILRWGAKKQLVAPALLALCAVLLLVYRTGAIPWLDLRRLRRAAAGLLAFACVLYAAIGYLPRGYNYIREQMPMGVYGVVSSRSGAQLIEDDGVYRVSQGKFEDPHAPVLGYMGTSFYWSMIPSYISEYYQALDLPTLSTTYHMYGLGGNVWMNAVAAVKYFIQHEGENYVTPYGFAPAGTLELPDGGSAALYENELSLPLGYAFDARMSESDYAALPVEARFQALLQRAVVDDAAGGDLAAPESGIEDAAVAVPFEVVGSENAEIDGHGIRAEQGGRITLSLDAPADSELYLLFSGLRTDRDDLAYDGMIALESGAGIARGNVLFPSNNFYFPKEDFAFCLGSDALERCDIVFEKAMDYAYDEMRVVALPMSVYREAAQARRDECMTDIALGKDAISGRIRVSGERILQIAVPYSDGWSARVDGVRQPVFRCGGMYMGIALAEGEHEIEMRYVTPGLIPGAAVSAAALLAAIVLAIITGVRRRRRKERETA